MSCRPLTRTEADELWKRIVAKSGGCNHDWREESREFSESSDGQPDEWYLNLRCQKCGDLDQKVIAFMASPSRETPVDNQIAEDK